MAQASEQKGKYDQFWPEYLKDHSKPLTRYIHFGGTAIALIILAWISLSGNWLSIWQVLLCAYLPAWISHFLIEGNKPCSFKSPFFAAFSNIRMFFLFLTGRLKGELHKAQIEDKGADGPQLFT